MSDTYFGICKICNLDTDLIEGLCADCSLCKTVDDFYSLSPRYRTKVKIIDCVQGSPEWFAAKCGIPSASNFDKLATSTGKPSKQRTKYMYRLAGEAITGIVEESYQNEAMLRGIELEAEARQLYRLVSGKEVIEVGFCLADGFGCSPDGLVGKSGLLEIKSPTVAVHVGYLSENALPIDYVQQVQGQLLVTGRKWCDFMSYYPGLKPLIVRVVRDEEYIEHLRAELETFCSELKDLVEKFK